MSWSYNTNCSITSPKYKPSHKSFSGACFVFLFWWKWPVCGAQGQKCCHTRATPHFPTAYCKGADQNHRGWNHFLTCPWEASIPQALSTANLLPSPSSCANPTNPASPSTQDSFLPATPGISTYSWQLCLIFKFLWMRVLVAPHICQYLLLSVLLILIIWVCI